MNRNEKKEKLIELMKMSDLDFYDEFLEKEAAEGDDLKEFDVKSEDILKMAANATFGK